MAQDDDASLDLLRDLIARVRRKGADAADAVRFHSTSLSLSRRLGALETLERAENTDIGLRAFKGKRQAVASTTDRSPRGLEELVARVIDMAKAVPEDPFCGLAPEDLLARDIPDNDLFDPEASTPETLLARAAKAEEAALAVAGITNSEGAEASWSEGHIALAASNGFAGAYRRSSHGLSVSVLAGSGTAMERDYDYASTVFASDLPDPAALGRSAGERAVKRLNPRKVATRQVPVVYDPRVGHSLLNHLASAINGTAIARGTSFLKEQLEKPVFAEGVQIIDDPLRRRGLRSRPFDGEGVATTSRAIVEDGRLTTWLLDSRSARRIGSRTTGHAARGTSAPPAPAPSNLYLAAGTHSPETLIAEIDNGFYVTELIGFGVNNVTGDYSRGASGYWIENGALAYPVSEVTIAGNLKDMFAHLVPADDLEFRYGIDTPTLRIDAITVAGQ